MIDSREIEELHPCLQRGVLELKRRLKKAGWDMGVSSTYRDNEQQDYLYSLGRTVSGQIITNAKGGESIHNYRLAFDIFNNVSGDLYPAEFLNLAGKIWAEMGGVWGGSWTSFQDKPHFQFTQYRSIMELQEGFKMKQRAKMTWEGNEVVTLDDAFGVYETWSISFDYEYWEGACKYINYLEALLIKIASQFDDLDSVKYKNEDDTLYGAFMNYGAHNIEFDQFYWEKACHYVKHLEALLIKIANQL